ncbi:uncharacterized protein LOC125655684 [Ostrea edulis]|uniref:uncharacterized protein LOC125655684 n=1 Tax=Ostrea edulis TaxID=37623 RepID=UPI0024AED5D4|nr:uncharacterized protein LOC125655684 [Ostrea edulis]
MGFKDNGLFLFVIALCLSPVQCSSASAGDIVGYVFSGIFGLAALITLTKFFFAKFCGSTEDSTTVRPRPDHLNTTGTASGEPHTSLAADVQPQYLQASGQTMPGQPM